MVALAVLIILVIALWKQNSKLKEEVSNLRDAIEFPSQVTQENSNSETPDSTQEELELLQKQIDQLVELQEKLN